MYLAGCQTEPSPQIVGQLPRDRSPLLRDWSALDTITTEELTTGKVPGAVVCVGKGDSILYLKAFGFRTVLPESYPMTTDTIFDLASLTKPVSTAACIQVLMDQGRLLPEDPVFRFLSAFDTPDKRPIQIRHLLTHTSGLPAYLDAAQLLKQYGTVCPDKVIETIAQSRLMTPPGEEFRYSCLGYITLGRIVEIVSGQSLDTFAAEHVFRPTGMRDTRYRPPADWLDRIAGTEMSGGGDPTRVHDPLARLMGGISGNAGLYGTAEDLARYCSMLLGNGTFRGTKILTQTAVQRMTTQQDAGRAFGFDVSSDYAWIKGKFASARTFCHSGYTGTSIVCDPESGAFIIILTNRVHPEDRGKVRDLRIRLADEVFSRFLVE
ncbi:MAG: beta-lactamase family protein [Phycisphaerae bacterium]|nr:beta-lactamase family protein [Phycisphaerae bacterium]